MNEKRNVMKIPVTTPTGKIGRRIVPELLRAGVFGACDRARSGTVAGRDSSSALRSIMT